MKNDEPEDGHAFSLHVPDEKVDQLPEVREYLDKVRDIVEPAAKKAMEDLFYLGFLGIDRETQMRLAKQNGKVNIRMDLEKDAADAVD